MLVKIVCVSFVLSCLSHVRSHALDCAYAEIGNEPRKQSVKTTAHALSSLLYTAAYHATPRYFWSDTRRGSRSYCQGTQPRSHASISLCIFDQYTLRNGCERSSTAHQKSNPLYFSSWLGRMLSSAGNDRGRGRDVFLSGLCISLRGTSWTDTDSATFRGPTFMAQCNSVRS